MLQEQTTQGGTGGAGGAGGATGNQNIYQISNLRSQHVAKEPLGTILIVVIIWHSANIYLFNKPAVGDFSYSDIAGELDP